MEMIYFISNTSWVTLIDKGGPMELEDFYAVFTTEEKAQSELRNYGKDAIIVPWPANQTIQAPPYGLTGFSLKTPGQGPLKISCETVCNYHMENSKNIGKVTIDAFFGVPRMHLTLWARDKDDAIAIASEKFKAEKAAWHWI